MAELTSVPGIGPATVAKLANSEIDEDRITNTYQLFGKFLMLKGPGHTEKEIEIDSLEHMEKFWHWLKNRGVSAHRSAIVRLTSVISPTDSCKQKGRVEKVSEKGHQKCNNQQDLPFRHPKYQPCCQE